MERKVKVKPADFNRYFKGFDLKKRVSVIETAETLLNLQKTDTAILTDTIPEKRGRVRRNEPAD